MLIDQLLLTLAVKDNCEIIKTLDHSSQLESVGQVNSYRDMLLSHLIQENILQIDILIHGLFLLVDTEIR